jgi:hypothetical protein
VGVGRLIAATAPSFVLVDRHPGQSATTPSRAISVLAMPGRVHLDPGPYVRFLEPHMKTE